MKITMLSNYLTHHQVPLCDALYRESGGNFRFLETEPMEEERTNMGWALSQESPYVIPAYADEEKERKARELLRDSDIIVFGICPDKWFREICLSNARFVFLYSERIFKKGAYQRFGFGARRYRERLEQLTRTKSVRVLCASAYLPTDLRRLGSGYDRCLKWGYFPPFERFLNAEEDIAQKKPCSILWAGRLLALKHPEDAVRLADRLKRAGYDFSLTVIGDGEMREYLQEEIDRKSLQNEVRIMGFLSPEEVRAHMRQADIFLFTSDRFEGWGAVVNESMNAGCAVVANKEIGSVPYLIRHKQNGMIYHRKKKGDLFKKVRFLLENPAAKAEMQFEAYNTVSNLWNADIAAKRFVEIADGLQRGESVVFEDGPCSKANVI